MLPTAATDVVPVIPDPTLPPTVSTGDASEEEEMDEDEL